MDQTPYVNGGCLTLSSLEYHNAEEECSLWQILETGQVDNRFYLSPKACAGILKRAERRGKKLPDLLKLALAQVAFRAQTEPALTTSSTNICQKPLEPLIQNVVAQI